MNPEQSVCRTLDPELAVSSPSTSPETEQPCFAQLISSMEVILDKSANHGLSQVNDLNINELRL